MTKRHFEAFAARIKADLEETRTRFPERHAETLRACSYAADLFAALAANDNPYFDRDRFLKACGLR